MGISRAPGAKRERKRFQSRVCPAGPEITSYSDFKIASTDATSAGFAGGGAAQTQTVQREEVGIKLRITPLVNADGYITTDITPEVSSVTDFRGPNSDLPVISTRQASTTVRLKDGNSVIIGGLLSEEKTRNVSKLPILGQIPGLGVLFQHHVIVTSKKDLVIEVTPRIIPDQQ